jgi:hypothetical protein
MRRQDSDDRPIYLSAVVGRSETGSHLLKLLGEE